MKKYFIFLFLLTLSINNIYAKKSSEPCKVLFIGSSYFNFNDLPGLFEGLVISSGREIYIDQWIPVGHYLDQHASNSAIKDLINSNDWDFVVLQGVGSLVAYPEYYTAHPVYPALLKFYDMIKANCESTKMVFCMPWAYEDGMTWMAGWTDTYEDMQIHIFNNTIEYLENIDFVIAPVGWAWYKVLKEKDYPLHYLHLSDWNHPSKRGSYLMACVIYSTLFQEASYELNYNGDLSNEDATNFQTVASNTVLDSLDLWNITPSNIYQGSSMLPKKFQIHQNYPNPFNSSTIIPFSITKPGFVSLKVYDILGREIYNFINEYRRSDSYSIKINRNNLISGIYLYKMQLENESSEIRKMVLLK